MKTRRLERLRVLGPPGVTLGGITVAGLPALLVGTAACAGLIGYRALGMTGEAERLGLYGFGSSAHIIAQVARFQGRRVFAFTRPGDEAGQTSARELGAEWAGDSLTAPPEKSVLSRTQMEGFTRWINPMPEASLRLWPPICT